MNVLDLGFFASIQSLQFQLEPATTIDGLIVIVFKAWADYNPMNLNKVFLSHMQCAEEVLLSDGGNQNALPHIGKDKILKETERLPKQLQLSEEAFNMCNLYK